MALKLKKDIKKSSYYVWFLGAKESKGLRGSEYVLPVIENLEEREKDIEPFKVTLQLSHKGLKIVQNILSQSSKTKPKNETIKHFIPHNTITCVHQKDDIIACILLLFNPVTKCPLHVHAYRCDSLETASLLKTQLQTLIERPENQKKFAEIESRLGRKEAKKFESSVGSDTGNSTRESESSEERFGGETSRVSTLYDSVAAELRAKLNKNDVPILLPPRDYDTVHRQKGNLTGIELRRCLNSNIVGQNVKGRRIESSGGSSGIGSDHAPSPESPDVHERYHGMDGHSTSDDDWNGDNETSLYLMDTVQTLPRHHQEKYDYRTEQRNPRQFDHKTSRQNLEEHIRKRLTKQNEDKNSVERFLEPQPKPRNERPRYRQEVNDDNDTYRKQQSHQQQYHQQQQHPVPKTRKDHFTHENSEFFKATLKKSSSSRHRSPSSRQRSPSPVSPKDRFKDAKEKFLLLERERIEQEIKARKEAAAQLPVAKERKHYYKEVEEYSRDGRDSRDGGRDGRDSRDGRDIGRDVRDIGRDIGRDGRDIGRDGRDLGKDGRDIGRDKDIGRDGKDIGRDGRDIGRDGRDIGRDGRDIGRDGRDSRDGGRDSREGRESREKPISPVHKEKGFVNRHESVNYDRYNYEPEKFYEDRYIDTVPKPAPRTVHQDEEVRYRRDHSERYRQADKFDPKRRSMFNLSEDHKRNSSEIAKELKRRSYLEDFGYGYEDSNFSKSNLDLDQVGGSKYLKNATKQTSAAYRNSYAEPKFRQEKKFEILHRTNSSVSNNGRVGIASVHPY